MKSVKNLLLLVIGLTLVMICLFGAWFISYTNTPSNGQGMALVEIPRGAGVKQIGTLLAEKNLLENDIRFLLLVRLKGSVSKLRAGEYLIEFGLTPEQVLEVLEEGKVHYHSVTIPEGLTASQAVEIFSKAGWGSIQRYQEILQDQEFITGLGLDHGSFEGYLYPDTYYLTRGAVTEKSVLEMMVGRFFQVVSELNYQASQFSLHQLVTLASIIEKETGAAIERPLIARVFLNRIDKKMKLQSDPTVIYGIENFNGNITRADLKRATPYNTYVIPGLPPGPICNPGKQAMLAVLYPADSNALFFVSKNDGTHYFSSSLREHNKAVRKYQKNRKARN